MLILTILRYCLVVCLWLVRNDIFWLDLPLWNGKICPRGHGDLKLGALCLVHPPVYSDVWIMQACIFLYHHNHLCIQLYANMFNYIITYSPVHLDVCKLPCIDIHINDDSASLTSRKDSSQIFLSSPLLSR